MTLARVLGRIAAGAACVAGLLRVTARAASPLDATLQLNQHQVLSWQIENGLPQNSVQAILRDRQGYMWLATQGGVARFDGVRFVVFDRSNTAAFLRENVLALAEDRDGAIWMGTDSGLICYRRGEFTRLGVGKGCRATECGRCTSTGRHLWVSDERRRVPAAHRRGRERRQDGGDARGVDATRISQTPDGALWFPGVYGLYRFAAGRLDRFGAAEGLPDDTVCDVLADGDGAVLAGTNRGVARMADGRAFPVDFGPVVGGDTVHAIFRDAAGMLYLGLERRGWAPGRRRSVEVHGQGEGFSANYVMDFLEDHEGNLWVASFDAGLACLRRTAFSGFGVREGLRTDDVQAIFQSHDGAVWIGTNSGGLSCFEDGRLDLGSRRGTGRRQRHVSLTEDDYGGIWIGMPRGVSCIRRTASRACQRTSCPSAAHARSCGITARCGSGRRTAASGR